MKKESGQQVSGPVYEEMGFAKSKKILRAQALEKLMLVALSMFQENVTHISRVMLESTSGLSEKKELEKLQERSVKQLCPQ
jgi:hypothetical protein